MIKFSAIYASTTFGIQGKELVGLFVFANIVAVPGTLVAGYVADWIGTRRALILMMLGWIGVLVLGATTTTRAGMWTMAAGVAMGMGGTQAIARSFMAQISPPSRESEFFGFYLLSGKFGAIVAFLVFGAASAMTGNQRSGVLWLIPLFVAGLAMLFVVRPVPSTDES